MTMGIKMMSSKIEDCLGYDLFNMNPGNVAQKIEIPALFICGKNDKLLPPECVINFYKKYYGKRKV